MKARPAALAMWLFGVAIGGVAAIPGNAAALVNNGRIADAIPNFEHALQLDPSDANARRNLERARKLQESERH